MMMFLLKLVLGYWIVAASFALIMCSRVFRKYAKRKQFPVDEEWHGLVRDDYEHWNKRKIILGAIFIFPYKMFLLIHILSMALILIIHPNIQAYARKFMNVYGRTIIGFIYHISQDFSDRSIKAPIIISNHVCWFDIFYLLYGFYPVSFISKEQVKSSFVIGSLAKSINCIFIRRKSVEDREHAIQSIKERINDFNSQQQNAFPLIIFPEGTCSNGKAILTFKNGAFDNLSPLSCFCFNYQCDNFGMGMDEITQPQHALLTLCQQPRLKVKRFTAQPAPQESVQEYRERVRGEMSKMLEKKLANAGYREVMELERLVEKQLNQ